MALSIVIIVLETVTHERTRIHIAVDLLLYVICTISGNRIFGCSQG